MSSRKLLWLSALVPFFFTGFASAQIGIYATVTGQRFGGITCPTFAAPCGSNNGKDNPYGGSFGAYYDFKDFGPVRLGADLRGEVLTGNKRADSTTGGGGTLRQYTVFGGVRGTVRTPIPWMHPYAEIAAGYLRNNASGLYTYTTTTNNTVTPPTSIQTLSYNPNLYKAYPAFKGIVGLDLRVLPFVDLRIIELGAGAAFGSTNTVNTVVNTQGATGITTTSTVNASSSSSHALQTIGAGIVFRIP
jgi:hypothetical protein